MDSDKSTIHLCVYTQVENKETKKSLKEETEG